MAGNLKGKRIAILAADMVKKTELAQPWQALRDAGAQVQNVSPDEGEIQSFHDLAARMLLERPCARRIRVYQLARG